MIPNLPEKETKYLKIISVALFFLGLFIGVHIR